MRIQTLSIVVGTRACNAACPFCVSKMTGFEELPRRGPIERVNFEKACRLAQVAGTTTVLMTGKGEPTLYPDEIGEYLDLLAPWRFPFIEMQTNALELGRLARDGRSRIPGLSETAVAGWRGRGLNTIAVSAVSERGEHNRQIYNADYPDLAATIGWLHGLGFTVRLCVMMHRGTVDSPERLRELLDFCGENGVEQLTVRPIRKPSAPTKDAGASRYVAERGLDEAQVSAVRAWLDRHGTRLLSLMHGAVVYDVGGRNCCLCDCLTVDASSDDIRTLIFYSDGRLAYDWQHDGAVLLRGAPPAKRGSARRAP